MNRQVIYTAIIGDYDNLQLPCNEDYLEDWDLICYTDQDLKSDYWKLVSIESKGDHTREARRIKICSHALLKKYVKSIWIDANATMLFDPVELFKTNHDITMLPHYQNRNGIKEEASECIRLKKDHSNIILKQINKYQQEGFNVYDGNIPMTTAIARYHNRCIDVMNKWYVEVLSFSKRDQISLPYVLWKMNKQVNLVNELKIERKHHKNG